ncbi:hypothetical protein [Streptomyces broussonetiae]|uniref:Uncharacterized protein n=1 Tax=Streptomyces broussonetiae TaxID=2686304 RepID=A0ABV5EFH1_9ACTN
MEEVALGGRVKSAGVGENGAIAWLRCEPKEGQPRSDAVSGRPYPAPVVVFNVGDPDLVPEDPSGRRRDIGAFLRAYLPGWEKAWCAAG